MPGNKSELGKQDRRRAAPGQAYELAKFAQKHRISKDQAKEIIRRARGNREQANTHVRWRSVKEQRLLPGLQPTGLHRGRSLFETWPLAFAVPETGTSWEGSTEKVRPHASVD